MSVAWLVPRAVRTARMDLCQACEHATGARRRKFFCSKCNNCVLEGKTRVADEACPIGKWHQHQPGVKKQ